MASPPASPRAVRGERWNEKVTASLGRLARRPAPWRRERPRWSWAAARAGKHDVPEKALLRHVRGWRAPSRSAVVPQSGEVEADVLEPRKSREASCCAASTFLKDDTEAHLTRGRALSIENAASLPHVEPTPLVNRGMSSEDRISVWPGLFSEPEVDLDSLCMHVPDETAQQIDADVPRTQPRLLGDAGQVMLRRVLRANASLEPTVGYCQGLNFVAATFVLLGFEDVVALQGLRSLTATCCPGYHGAGLDGYLRDARVLEALARRVLPAVVCRRLDALGVPLDLLASDHFLTLAAGGPGAWPLPALARLWDLMLLEGQPALFASFLALLSLYLPEEGLADSCGPSPGAASVPGLVEEPLDPVQAFRRAASQGAAEDTDTVLDEVRRLLPLVPQQLLDQLRKADEVGVQQRLRGRG